MNRFAVALAAAALVSATPAAAQDFAGPIAAAVDQFGQGMAESMGAGQGLFVTAQGKAPMPAAGTARMVLTIKGTGQTAVEAVADRNRQLDAVRGVANRFDVAIEVGGTNYSIDETPSWMADTAMPAIDWDAAAEAAADAVEAAASDDEVSVELIEPLASTEPSQASVRTVTASVEVKIERPNETRLPGFVDALVEAGVTDLNDGLNGMNLGQFQPFMSLLGLDTARDPGEPVWNEATADGVRRARAQAEAIAEASGRRLGPVRHVSVLMRSHDGENALVSVAVRFGFED